MILRNLFERFIYKKIDGPNTEGPKYSRYKFLICRICYRIIKIPLFNIIINILIISNTVALATDSFPKPELDVINETHKMFTVLFSIECIIRIVGLRWSQWKKEKFNIIDLVIVLLSWMEMMADSS